jgi:hypothetical protein
MDRQQIRWALLKISFVAVCASTWVFVSFVFGSRPEELAEDTEMNPIATLVRLPASLPTQLPSQLPKILGAPLKGTDPIRMDVVKLGCWDRTAEREQTVGARWVRLTGRPCQGSAELESIRILNQSNGYQGTVFTGERDQMTTDFIPLQEGPNNIIFQISQADGVVFENQVVLIKDSSD